MKQKCRKFAKQVLLEIVQGYPRASLTKNFRESKKKKIFNRQRADQKFKGAEGKLYYKPSIIKSQLKMRKQD